MTKTRAKLQARARKTSRKNAVASRAKRKARPKQTFNVSHFRSDDFRADGLRSYAKYRDLGMSKATNGLLQAHVIRFIPPCDPAVVSKRHFHEVDVQMIYVLKGWINLNLRVKARSRCAKAPLGCSHRALSTLCSTIPTTASCSKSSYPRSSKP